MINYTLPRVFVLVSMFSSICAVHQASAQPLVNGLSRCLVYTWEETETTQGRSRPEGKGTPVYSQSTSKIYGLLVVGPRKIEKAQHYDYNGTGELTVNVKVADCLNYRFYSMPSVKYAFSSSETYALGVLNTGRAANPSSNALLVANWFSRGGFQLSTSVPAFGVQGRARLASPYPGLSSIWHADLLTSRSDTIQTAYSSRPVGFSPSATDDRKNLADAYRVESRTTYRFDKSLSEMVKDANSIEQSKSTIDNYLKSKEGGGYLMN